MNTSRREFFKVSLLGSAILLVGSSLSAIALANPSTKNLQKFDFLQASDADFLLALAPVMLKSNYPGVLAEDAGVRLLMAVDQQIITLGEHSQKQLRQLFDLMSSTTFRYLVGAPTSDWNVTSAKEIESFLQGWKNSLFSLKRTGYASLGKLIIMSWYAQSENYLQAGYPGPPKIYPSQE
ncbi:hypothetical protein [Colwellia sp. BRX8-9]|uniref:hypothetical protein n=1 Tax=Colwellia sp. BRX8-9 TaxID=2759831 RepID=UPI0015F4EE4E|nr:hypothetical protein [Colwellia sp. BRX8-9]MBA6349436.1 hypothetical protein [Colwellia sp. BRX8-9]